MHITAIFKKLYKYKLWQQNLKFLYLLTTKLFCLLKLVCECKQWLTDVKFEFGYLFDLVGFRLRWKKNTFSESLLRVWAAFLRIFWFSFDSFLTVLCRFLRVFNGFKGFSCQFWHLTVTISPFLESSSHSAEFSIKIR
jgi:hypothetical protein